MAMDRAEAKSQEVAQKREAVERLEQRRNAQICGRDKLRRLTTSEVENKKFVATNIDALFQFKLIGWCPEDQALSRIRQGAPAEIAVCADIYTSLHPSAEIKATKDSKETKVVSVTPKDWGCHLDDVLYVAVMMFLSKHRDRAEQSQWAKIIFELHKMGANPHNQDCNKELGDLREILDIEKHVRWEWDFPTAFNLLFEAEQEATEWKKIVELFKEHASCFEKVGSFVAFISELLASEKADFFKHHQFRVLLSLFPEKVFLAIKDSDTLNKIYSEFFKPEDEFESGVECLKEFFSDLLCHGVRIENLLNDFLMEKLAASFAKHQLNFLEYMLQIASKALKIVAQENQQTFINQFFVSRGIDIDKDLKRIEDLLINLKLDFSTKLIELIANNGSLDPRCHILVLFRYYHKEFLTAFRTNADFRQHSMLHILRLETAYSASDCLIEALKKHCPQELQNVIVKNKDDIFDRLSSNWDRNGVETNDNGVKQLFILLGEYKEGLNFSQIVRFIDMFRYSKEADELKWVLVPSDKLQLKETDAQVQKSTNDAKDSKTSIDSPVRVAAVHGTQFASRLASGAQQQQREVKDGRQALTG